MVNERFASRLERSWAQQRYLCVGLDPDPAQLGDTADSGARAAIIRFAREIVDATADLAIAYKPNIAFYEQFGPPGLAALREVIGHIHAVAPDAVVILDAKRGDIEHTNAAYASALFDYFDADAVTVQPYLGGEALAPFLARADRGVIVLCRTSNPGGAELQDLEVGGIPLYQHVARLVESAWNAANGNCGLLVGATWPAEIAQVRAAAPTLPLLIAGVGRQQGALAEAVRAGLRGDLVGGGGIIVSASRSITDVGLDPSGRPAAARAAALRLVEEIAAALAGDIAAAADGSSGV